LRTQDRFLQAVTPLQQHRVVEPEFIGKVLRRRALREASKNHHDDRTVVSNAGKDRAGERVENGPALVAAVAYHRRASRWPLVWGLAIGQLVALRAMQALWVQKLYEKVVALLLARGRSSIGNLSIAETEKLEKLERQ
jgi:hypothetical protein